MPGLRDRKRQQSMGRFLQQPFTTWLRPELPAGDRLETLLGEEQRRPEISLQMSQSSVKDRGLKDIVNDSKFNRACGS